MDETSIAFVEANAEDKESHGLRALHGRSAKDCYEDLGNARKKSTLLKKRVQQPEALKVACIQ